MDYNIIKSSLIGFLNIYVGLGPEGFFFAFDSINCCCQSAIFCQCAKRQCSNRQRHLAAQSDRLAERAFFLCVCLCVQTFPLFYGGPEGTRKGEQWKAGEGGAMFSKSKTFFGRVKKKIVSSFLWDFAQNLSNWNFFFLQFAKFSPALYFPVWIKFWLCKKKKKK